MRFTKNRKLTNYSTVQVQMTKINLIVAALLISTIGCSQKVSFSTLSNKIYSKNGGANDKSTFKLNTYKRDARMKVYQIDSASFLKVKIDTLYLIEGYNIETGTFYGTIWDKKNSISYNYFKANLALQKQSTFTDYQVQLITRWDTATIKKEEKANGNWLDNNLQINALRCYKKGKDWQIDEIYFKNFYDPKRNK
ncbi:hypothetical protein EON73_02835 [bacterium]|nr:MAG: hypothetical protein EON73_02835 [bacterium]